MSNTTIPFSPCSSLGLPILPTNPNGTPNYSNYNYSPDKDRGGADISCTFSGADINKCRQECDGDVNCKSFNYFPYNGGQACCKKNDATLASITTSVGTNLYVKKTPIYTDYATYVGKVNQGPDITYITNVSEDICKRECDATPNCKAFNVYQSGGVQYCWLKTGLTVTADNAAVTLFSKRRVLTPTGLAPNANGLPNYTNYTNYNNKFYTAANIACVFAPNTDDCKQQCDANTSCKAFGWELGNKSCCLKSDATLTNLAAYTGIDTYVKKQPIYSNYTLNAGKDRGGADIGSCLALDTINLDDCKQKCDADNNCKAFNYWVNGPAPYCCLKNDATPANITTNAATDLYVKN